MYVWCIIVNEFDLFFIFGGFDPKSVCLIWHAKLYEQHIIMSRVLFCSKTDCFLEGVIIKYAMANNDIG